MEKMAVTEGQQSNYNDGNVLRFLGANNIEDMPDRIYTAMLRYIAILDSECPELTYREWMCLMQTMKDSDRNFTDTFIDRAKLLFMEIRLGERQDGLGTKWQVDAEALSNKLYGYSYAQQCAIVEVVNRWWSGLFDSEEEIHKQLLLRSGAKIKE